MRKPAWLTLLFFFLGAAMAHATVFGDVQGIVHDPHHQPIENARVVLRSRTSAFSMTASTDSSGAFRMLGVPLGEYTLTASQAGFAPLSESLTLASGSSPILHFELALAAMTQSITVHADELTASADSVTPTTLLSRSEIAQTPGADRTNSLAMITDFVPGAYMTHDMLHMRGGHQVSWLIDGVQIPNTNIAGNVGAQIAPQDIDYLETQRGSYNAEAGDRTYGVFDIVPRSGFELFDDAELCASFGSLFQTDQHFDFGSHNAKSAYYVSANGNRTNYGLSTPSSAIVHDAANGYGGFASLLSNRSAKEQLRLVLQARSDFFQIPYDPDAVDYQNQLSPSLGLRDGQHETDGLVALTLSHTFNASTVLDVSPFFHGNTASYESDPKDDPVATTSRRASKYGGAQASLRTHVTHNTMQAGVYGWGQHDSVLLAATDAGGGPGLPATFGTAAGGLVEAFLSDNFRVAPWLTVIGGIRASHFDADQSETAASPRVGAAVRVPRLGWVFRGFYGRFYQPPPLLSATGPLAGLANANNTAFQPLHGERDEEHQFGVQIPLPQPMRGWMLDADTFKTRANNFLDHSNIGESSIYIPVTIEGALVQAWELTLRSPREWRRGGVHLAYSNQVAKQRGPIQGGLICFPSGSPQCAAPAGYRALDHDQRNTLNAGFHSDLPWRTFASSNLYYGSGFSNGFQDPPSPYAADHLPQHTTFDVALGKKLGENATFTVTAINVANRRVLLDNSLTFGGFHQNDPRQIVAQVRYRLHL